MSFPHQSVSNVSMESNDSLMTLKHFLQQFYEKHNPAMLKHVDKVAANWAGYEGALYHKMLSRYPELSSEFEWLVSRADL